MLEELSLKMIESLQRSYTYIQIHWFAANTLQARDFSSKLLETCASIVRDFNAQDRKYCAKSRCLFQIATLLERKWDSRSTCKKTCPLGVYFSPKKNVPKTLRKRWPSHHWFRWSQPQVEFVKSRYVPRWFHWFLAWNDKIRSALAKKGDSPWFPIFCFQLKLGVPSQWHACAISLALISLTPQLLLSWAVSFRGCLHTQKLLHWTALTHRHFYTLHAELFTQTSFYAETLLHGNAFAYRGVFMHGRLYTQKLFTQKSFYTEQPLHRWLLRKNAIDTETYTQSSFYADPSSTQKLYTEQRLHKVFTRGAFKHRHSLYTHELLHREVFYPEMLLTRRSVYTQTPLHTEAFSKRGLCSEQLLHIEAFTPLHTDAFT